MFAVGSAAFVWDKMANSTGNANPRSVLIAAGAVGVIAFIFLFSLFKWVLNI